MFNRSRNKIILSIMGSLVLLFVITLSVILFASFREVRQKNLDILERFVDLYTIEQRPGSRDNPGPLPMPGNLPPDIRPDFQLSTFYSVSFAEDGSVLAVDDGDKGVYEEEELIKNDDGTISVNSFVMPSSDVRIVAKFKETIVNPKTGVSIPIP